MKTTNDESTRQEHRTAGNYNAALPAEITPFLSILGTPDLEVGHCPPRAVPSGEFAALTAEEKVRFLRQAQAALRFLEADLTDEPRKVSDRHQALAHLTGGAPTLPGYDERAVQDGLPSYWPYWNAYMVADYVLSLFEDRSDIEPDMLKERGHFEEVMKHLLGFARDEAALVGFDLDDLMRGWFENAPVRVPHGSPTAGLSTM